MCSQRRRVCVCVEGGLREAVGGEEGEKRSVSESQLFPEATGNKEVGEREGEGERGLKGVDNMFPLLLNGERNNTIAAANTQLKCTTGEPQRFSRTAAHLHSGFLELSGCIFFIVRRRCVSETFSRAVNRNSMSLFIHPGSKRWKS